MSARKPKNGARESKQREFGIIWLPKDRPFRLQAGDVIRMDNQLCRVLRVTDCSAVILIRRPAREFKTRFDKPVRFQPSPKIIRISPNSEVEIVHRTNGHPSKRKPR